MTARKAIVIGPDYLRRRVLVSAVVALSGLVVPFGSFAQSKTKVWLIGVLNPRTRSAPEAQDAYTRFFKALRELGYADGHNIAIEWRFADNDLQRLPGLAAQLVKNKVDLIATNATAAVRAAQQATATIPIVALTFSDPVGNGFAKSLARPGGNITGMTIIEEDLLVKRLEIMTEIAPHAARIAYLANPDNPLETRKYARLDAAARKARKATLLVNARTTNEFSTAFDSMARERADALLVAADTLFLDHAPRIGALALKIKLPCLWSVETFAEHGLATYGPDPDRRSQRAAALAVKIFKGTKPADIPIERPTHFNLVVNLKIAKALGITIPPAVMVQATQVIE